MSPVETHDRVMPKDIQYADAELGWLDDLVDTTRYPLDDPDSTAWTALVDQCRSEISEHGCLTLRDFLRPEARRTAGTEIADLARGVPIRYETCTVYSRPGLEAELALDDPRRLTFRRGTGHITRDMIGPHTVAHRLYASPKFKAFVKDCVGAESIFEYADPLAGLIATVVPPGNELSWHYDTNEYVVTLMTQQPDAGGLFCYVPNLRRPGDENIDGLGAVLADPEHPSIRTVDLRPGDLQIFLGRYSLHKVGKVTGTTDRHVAVLSYADRPGVIGPVDRTRAVYGRVTEAHLVAEQSKLQSNDGLML